MSRHYKNYDSYDDYDDYDNYGKNVQNPIGALIVFGIFILISEYYTNRERFWHWLVYVVIALVFLVATYILILRFKQKRRNKIVSEIKRVNQDITQMVEGIRKEDFTKTKNVPTRQALALHDALVARGIKCELEKNDGFKRIDIAIPWARVNIEIDGSQHYLDPKQVIADYNRTFYSMRKGYKTFRYPNFFIDKYLDKVADTVAKVARDEYYKKH